MRFIFAIFAFIIATALIGAGVAQRTVFLPPDTVSASVITDGTAPYVMIDSDTLLTHDGKQSLVISGSSTVFAAYGRTSDVEAWLDGSDYERIGYDDSSRELTAENVSANPDAAENVASGSANPAGSDLWLEQYTAEDAMYRTVNLPAGYSVIVAADGTSPAPTSISISWPIPNATPWVGPLLVAGVVFLFAGLVLLVLGLLHMRRSQRPRRKPPALPKGKRFSPSRTNAIESGMKRGRRSIASFVAAPVALVSVLAFSGCSSDYWPQAAAPTPVASDAATTAATPDPTPTPGEPVETVDDGTPMPAVTQAQLEGIVSSISTVAAEGDAASSADALSPRFTGPALDLRKTTYAIRGGFPEYAAPQPIPAGPLEVVLPQASNSWPKTVFTVVQGADTTVPPVALMLEQETARSNYKVYYAITLEPDTSLPSVAAASVGTTRLAPETKLLTMTPEQLKTAYADILQFGDASGYIGDVDPTGDTLRTQVGVDYKNSAKAALASTASMEFATVPAPGQNIALATTESGALVAVNLRESQTVKPAESGATVSPTGAVKALSGVNESSKGTEAIFDYQLLFYIPPSGDTTKAELLGFTQGLVQAKELP